MKKLLLIFPLVLQVLLAFGQQSVQYSQYVFNQLYINPAYAGYKDRFNIHVYYRNQWTGIERSPKSMSGVIDGLMNNDHVGLSLQVSSDQLGAQKNASIYGTYAYHILFDDLESKLSFGLSGGLEQTSVNGNLLNPVDKGDEYVPVGIQRKIYPDARAGIFFANQQFFIGFSAYNLIGSYLMTSNPLHFPVPKTHLYLSTGLAVPIHDELAFKPSLLLKDDSAGPSSLDVNAMFLIKEKILLGGGYRTGVNIYKKSNLQNNREYRNALMGMAEFNIEKRFKIGYAYEYSLRNLGQYFGATHEISVGIYINDTQ